MRVETFHNEDLFNFLVVIPMIGDVGRLSLWEIHGQSLLSMTIKVALSTPMIKQIILVVDENRRFENVDLADRIDVIYVSKSDTNIEYSCNFLITLAKEVFKYIGEYSEGDENYHGLVVLDPLCPLRRPSHVKDGIDIYLSQVGRPRPWCSVTSVELLPNHFHPKKILKLTDTGELDYFNQEGRKVYRRQQLKDDNYYVENGVAFIFDPIIANDSFAGNKEMLGYIIEEPIIGINKRYDLDLVEDLMSTHNRRINDN